MPTSPVVCQETASPSAVIWIVPAAHAPVGVATTASRPPSAQAHDLLRAALVATDRARLSFEDGLAVLGTTVRTCIDYAMASIRLDHCDFIDSTDRDRARSRVSVTIRFTRRERPPHPSRGIVTSRCSVEAHESAVTGERGAAWPSQGSPLRRRHGRRSLRLREVGGRAVGGSPHDGLRAEPCRGSAAARFVLTGRSRSAGALGAGHAHRSRGALNHRRAAT